MQVLGARCLQENTLLDFVDGRLTPGEIEVVARHADACQSCSDMIDEALQTGSSISSTRTQPMTTQGEPWIEGALIGDKYQLGRCLGAGGMGVVFEATNTWTRRRVAVKRLHARLADDEELAQRFLQEAQAATRIVHPNVVEVLDVARDGDHTLYMVQEFLEGETLRRRLDRGKRLPPDEARALMVPVMEALAAAHAAGVLHRDVKPENIFLATDAAGAMAPKLIDFGLSKIVSPDHVVAHSDVGRAMGTPSYMAPEQLRADEPLDGRVDVWSAGVVWFELLAGERPFRGAGYGAIAARILDGKRRRLREIAPQVPIRLAAAVERALAAPDRRFPTMGAFLAAVRDDKRRPASHRWAIGAAAVLAATAAGIGAWSLRKPVAAAPPVVAIPAVIRAPTGAVSAATANVPPATMAKATTPAPIHAATSRKLAKPSTPTAPMAAAPALSAPADPDGASQPATSPRGANRAPIISP